jgi:molybdate transport system substrate-binding protein
MPSPAWERRISTALLCKFSVLLSSFLLVAIWAQAQPQPLLIAAAADLAPLKSDLTAALTKATGGPVQFSFGGSGMLARQIESGAPYDVYLSANEAFVRELETTGRLREGTAAVYALGRLGLWSKSGKYRQVSDLVGVVHLALPNPAHAPYGVAARHLLREQGLWSRLEAKIVYGENVQQTLQYATSGNADACLTAWSLVRDKGGILIEPASHPELRQVGAVVAASKRQAQAARVLAWLAGPQGKALLARYGFGTP